MRHGSPSMKFSLRDSLRGAPDEEVLEDLRRGAEKLGKNTITIAEYEEVGRAHPSMLQRRLGSWSKALDAAGLEQSRSKIGIAHEELMLNLKNVWVGLGRQPSYSEMRKPVSEYSVGTYEKRYGGWQKALVSFVEWTDSEDENSCGEPYGEDTVKESAHPRKKRTKRDISERQRFRILPRDGFRCNSCGASPLTTPGVELHVDHITPWSKGGETIDTNLQAKCSRCNLGKGNAFDA